MREITGIFETADDARNAIQALHAAGVPEEDIAFLIATPEDDARPSAAKRTEDAGRRMGELAADVGETAAAFVPFVGRNVADSPLGRALRQAAETGGAVTGRVIGALSEGGLIGSNAPPDDASRHRAAVTVRTPSGREAQVVGLYTQAGAVQVQTRTG